MIPFVIRGHLLSARGVKNCKGGGDNLYLITDKVTDNINTIIGDILSPHCAEGVYRNYLTVCASGRQGQAKEDA